MAVRATNTCRTSSLRLQGGRGGDADGSIDNALSPPPVHISVHQEHGTTDPVQPYQRPQMLQLMQVQVACDKGIHDGMSDYVQCWAWLQVCRGAWH